MRNPVSLGVFLALAADARLPFTVVELAGRGVTANAAATRWVLEVGKPSLDGFTLADMLIELGEWEDRLVELPELCLDRAGRPVSASWSPWLSERD